jgi:hypothetical protein
MSEHRTAIFVGFADIENTIQFGLTPAARVEGLDKHLQGLKPHARVIC